MNDCFGKGVFPDELKLADMPLFFEKCESQDKEKFIFDVFLFHMLKVFERILYKESFLNKIIILLLKEMKFWKKHLGKVDQIGIILGDPSKAFGTLIMVYYWLN